jgi:hypothetical protein
LGIKGVFRSWFDVENEELALLLCCWILKVSVTLSALWQQRLPTGQYITSLCKLNHLIYYAMQISRNLP